MDNKNTSGKTSTLLAVGIFSATLVVCVTAVIYFVFFHVSKRDYTQALTNVGNSRRALASLSAGEVAITSASYQGEKILSEITMREARLAAFKASIPSVANSRLIRDKEVADTFSRYDDKATIYHSKYQQYYTDLKKVLPPLFNCLITAEKASDIDALATIYSTCKMQMDSLDSLNDPGATALRDALKTYATKQGDIIRKREDTSLTDSEWEVIAAQAPRNSDAFDTALNRASAEGIKSLEDASPTNELAALETLLKQRTR